MSTARDHNMSVAMMREAALAACPPYRCEAAECTNAGLTSLVATVDEGGWEINRLLCVEHWNEWRRPGGAYPTAAAARDALMTKWGWPGEAWWRD